MKYVQLGGECNAKDVVYIASREDVSNSCTYKYIGMTSEEIRKRIAKHKQSFNNDNYKGQTCLSRKVWDIKEKSNQCPNVNFKIIKYSKSYTAGGTICLLCTDEKVKI